VVGTLPLSGPLLVNEGQIEIEVRAAGYKTDRRTITLAGAASSQVTVGLDAEAPVAKPTPPSVAEPSPKPEATTPRLDEKPMVREAPPASGELPAWRRVLPWSLAGAAVAAGALGVWQQTSSSSALRQFEAIPACGATLPKRGADSRCAGFYDQFSSRQTNARVGYMAAGVLAAGAIGFFIWNAATPTSASVALAPGEVQLSFRGSF
jgi:hypothetical protein